MPRVPLVLVLPQGAPWLWCEEADVDAPIPATVKGDDGMLIITWSTPSSHLVVIAHVITVVQLMCFFIRNNTFLSFFVSFLKPLQPAKHHEKSSRSYINLKSVNFQIPSRTAYTTPASQTFATLHSIFISTIMSGNFFPSIGSMADKANEKTESTGQTDASTEDSPLQEIESLCMKCGEQVGYTHRHWSVILVTPYRREWHACFWHPSPTSVKWS